MSPTILDGRKTREALMPELIARVKGLSFVPKLAIIQVGSRPDSSAYIKGKQAFASKIGIEEKLIKVDESISQSELIEIVKECNVDASIRGIIVQLPLPLTIHQDTIIDTIDPRKDVDGLTALNVKRWLEGREDAVVPATARGVHELLKHYDINLFGKKVTVIGRSMLVGKPIAAMCLAENATVSICHSKTPNLEDYTKEADVVIVAIGKPGFITGKHVKAGQVIVDVGISNSVEGKLTGDVDFEPVSKIVSAISPVPGGVGLMTVIALFENLVDLCG